MGNEIGSRGLIKIDFSPLNTRSTLIGHGIIGFVLIELIKLSKFGLPLLSYTGGKMSIKKKKGAASYLKVLNLFTGFIILTN